MSDKLLTVDELIVLLAGYGHNELHIHHTWAPGHDDFKGDNHQALQAGMRNYHMNNLGWSDIGQHVTLFPDGLFITGRDFERTPASIKGYNTGSFAVEMLGNFDTGNDTFEGEQKASIVKLAKFFDDQGKYCRFHRENASKTCPGTSIDKDAFMSDVRALTNEQEAAEWATDAQEWCIEQGITDGTNPKDNVTREQVWVMIHRAHRGE